MKKTLRPARGLSERTIQNTCLDYLKVDGWYHVSLDPPHMRGLAVHKKGAPDDLLMRPITELHLKAAFPGCCCALFIEWKKEGGKAGEHQIERHRELRALGFVVLVAGEQFPKSIEGFLNWYRGSGLLRHLRE